MTFNTPKWWKKIFSSSYFLLSLTLSHTVRWRQKAPIHYCFFLFFSSLPYRNCVCCVRWRKWDFCVYMLPLQKDEKKICVRSLFSLGVSLCGGLPIKFSKRVWKKSHTFEAENGKVFFSHFAFVSARCWIYNDRKSTRD